MTEQPPPPPPTPAYSAPVTPPSRPAPANRGKALLVAAVTAAAVASASAGFAVVQVLQGDEDERSLPSVSASVSATAESTREPTSELPTTPTASSSVTAAPAPSATVAPVPAPATSPGEAVGPIPTTEMPPGRVLAIGSPQVGVFVPKRWERASPPDLGPDLFIRNAGLTTRVFTARGDPARPAAAVFDDLRRTVLMAERYPGVRTGAGKELEAFGALASVGVQYYRGQWVKDGLRIAVDGLIYVAVRKDGTILILQVEGLRDVEDRFDDWQPVVDTTFELLAES